MTQPAQRRPLEGLRVADFTWFGAGPMGTRPLAHYGAEVIVVESEARGGLRHSPPFRDGAEGLNRSGFFNNFNSEKLSITLNLRRPEAVTLAKRLIAVSDIVVNNFSPGVMDRWGLGYADLVQIKPEVIMAEMPVAGRTGPYRGMIGFGATIEAFSGLNHLTGYPDRPPAGTEINYPDYASNPYHFLTAILAALHYRRKTGKGQYIEVAQLESTVATTGTALLEYSANGTAPQRNGNRADFAAPHNAYPCLGNDRWVAVAVTSDEQWTAFRRALGDPAWAADARFATLAGRKAHEPALDEAIAEWTRGHRAEAVAAFLQAAGIPAAAVASIANVVDDPQLAHRGFLRRLDHPETGPTLYDGPVAHLSATPGEVRRPAPLLGEHNDYVYREVLGLSQEELDGWIAAGVIG
ncbi:MAG: CoA transferase [Chloroflexi bacterium]|nr:CoA transferase [Chloroflexota bacterium]